MPMVFKKFVLSFLSALVLLFSFAPFFEAKAASATTAPANTGSAASPWYNQNFFDWYDKVYNENTSPGNEIFGERYTAAQVQWVFYSVMSFALNSPYMILGFFGINVASPTPTVCILGMIHGSLDPVTCVQSVGNVINAFVSRLAVAPDSSNLASNQNLWADVFSTRRPISFIGYVSDTLQKLNPVSEVHAQTTGGFGFSRLLVISDFWSVTRNAAYAILIIAVIAIAFMIMFRVKISPQAAITIQSAIPRIVITLILITFSLAIAGLMIDLMYIVIGFISTLLPTLAGVSASPTDAYNFLVGGGPHTDAVIMIGMYFVLYLLMYLVTTAVVLISSLATLNLTSIVFAVLMLVFSIILLFILVINWAKVIFMLIKTVALIYVAVIVAPLQLMMGVFPGPLGAGAFSGWLKGLVAKLAVFPVAGLLLFFSFKFLGMSFNLAGQGILRAYNQNITTQQITAMCTRGMQTSTSGICNYFFQNLVANGASFWGPPLLGDAGAITGLVFLLISVGAILMIPKVADMVEGFLSGKPIGFGAAIGEALSPAEAAGKLAQGAAIGYGATEASKALITYRTNLAKQGVDQKSLNARVVNLLEGLVEGLKPHSGK